MKVSKQIFLMMAMGFAFFSALFGAGNLIIPPDIGITSGNMWLPALVGFALSGMLFPVITIIAIFRTGGTEEDIAAKVGPRFSMFLITVVMVCTGFLIIIPRTAAVTHELGVVSIFGPAPRIVTSLVFFALVIYFALNPSTVIMKLGKYFAPILIGIMLIIVVKGIVSPLGSPPDLGLTQASAFHLGFTEGYQTLDVFGGLVMSGVIIAVIATLKLSGRAAEMKMVCVTAAVAGLGLLIIYGGLIYIAASGVDVLAGKEGSTLPIAIINALFAGRGSAVFGILTILACLTTAIGMATGTASFFSRATKEKLKYKTAVILICVMSGLFSILGVDAIIHYAEPVLLLVYPTTIALVLLNVLPCRAYNRGTFIGVAYSTLLVGLFEAFPLMGIADGISAWMRSVTGGLWLSDYGLAWLLPALVCGVVGTLVCKLWPT